MLIDYSQIVIDQINLLVKCQEKSYMDNDFNTLTDISIVISTILEKHSLMLTND
jgi:hypothetical protein